MRDITHIVVHHSVTPRDLDIDKSIRSFDRNHRERLKYMTDSLGHHIAYHYVIGGNGEVRQTRLLEDVGHHASNLKINKASIGICLTGWFDKGHEMPSEAQEAALSKLLVDLAGQFKVKPEKIVPHRAFANKTCYGDALADDWAKNLYLSAVTNSNMIVYQQKGKPALYVAVGTTLIPFATNWDTYLKEFKNAVIVELDDKKFQQFTVSKTVAITKT